MELVKIFVLLVMSACVCHGAYFVMIQGHFNFDTARAKCSSHNMDMAVIGNSGQQEIATELTRVADHQGCVAGVGGGCKVFIRVKRIGNTNDFHVVDGNLRYTHWQSGEPNNYNNNENCVEMNNYGTTGEWNDTPCSSQISVLCMKGGKLFVMIQGNFNYATGEARCAAAGMDVAVIYDADEASQANDETKEADHPGCKRTHNHRQHCWVWIAFQKGSQGLFKWMGGLSTYTKWQDGQPNNYGRNQKCTQMNYDGNTWNDEGCGSPMSVLCQKVSMARGLLTEQSHTQWYGYPDVAVDDNRNGHHLGVWSCTESNNNGEKYWLVDLEETVTNIIFIVKNRADCCQDQLKSMDFYLASFPLKRSQHNIAHRCAVNTWAPANGKTTITKSCSKTGRYATITKNAGYGMLSLCEVIILRA